MGWILLLVSASTWLVLALSKAEIFVCSHNLFQPLLVPVLTTKNKIWRSNYFKWVYFLFLSWCISMKNKNWEESFQLSFRFLRCSSLQEEILGRCWRAVVTRKNLKHTEKVLELCTYGQKRVKMFHSSCFSIVSLRCSERTSHGNTVTSLIA